MHLVLIDDNECTNAGRTAQLFSVFCARNCIRTQILKFITTEWLHKNISFYSIFRFGITIYLELLEIYLTTLSGLIYLFIYEITILCCVLYHDLTGTLFNWLYNMGGLSHTLHFDFACCNKCGIAVMHIFDIVVLLSNKRRSRLAIAQNQYHMYISTFIYIYALPESAVTL